MVIYETSTELTGIVSSVLKKQIMRLFLFILVLVQFSCAEKQEPMSEVIERSIKVAEQQARAMAATLADQGGRLPKTFKQETEEFVTSNSRDWCSGFFPGTLWYLYEYTNNDEFKRLAEEYTLRVEREQYNKGTHDLGFMIFCSYGNGLRLTNNAAYPDIITTASRSLCTRYNPKVELIKSWDSFKDKWQYPVIIDNMMNLEMLMWAFKQTKDSTFYNIAVTHADKTIQHHFRTDYSTWHVVSYDTITGIPHAKQTHQGAFDESMWARGEAWGLYGYTMMYRETGKKEYLNQAINIADLMIGHPNMPTDGIPYWDFNAPNIPNEERDASTGAIMASALIELSGYVNDTAKKAKYLEQAEKQIRTLSSPEYLAEQGTNGNFIIKHGVGHKPNNSEVDAPLTYADYYFVEALLRYKKLLK